jgi:hypothetical protein
MSEFKQRLIIIGNVILFISVIASLIFRTTGFLLLGLILILFLFYVYLYSQQVEKIQESEMESKSRTIIDNNVCIKPNKNNPFMNPNIVDYDNANNNIKACDYNNDKINRDIDKFFKEPVFKDINDIYDRKFSQRQFYTVPATTIPNDRESYTDWLYYRPKTCKENNGEQCYNNIM